MHTGTSFRTKIFVCMLFAILVALSLPALYVRLYLDDILLAEAQQQALREAKLTAALLEAYSQPEKLPAFVHSLHSTNTRISLVDAAGKVLADSTLDITALPQLDNHNDRPEIRDSRRFGTGLSTRYSNTVQSGTIYAAVQMDNGLIVRIAVPHTDLQERLDSRRSTIAWVGVLAVALALMLAYFLSYKLKQSLDAMVNVVEAISLGKYKRRLHTVPGSEFSIMADAVNRMAEHIDSHISTEADQKGQLLSILETMHDGVLVLDNKGRIRSCNQALLDMFPAAYAAIDAPVVEAIPLPQLHEAVEKMLHNQESAGCNIQLELPPARVVNVHITRPETPTPQLGAVVVFHDVSELVRLERIRRDFVTNVSHELRTPLTAIQGYAETLGHMDNMPPDCTRFAEIIHKHAAYLGRMVEELLSLARLENGQAAIPMQSLNITDCVMGGVNLCVEALQAKSVRVDVDMPAELMVMGNHTHLVQVFRNLMENACRFAPPESTISVQGHKTNALASISVSDMGCGIPTEELGRIFERFYRVDKHRSSGFGTTGNTGLGLAICKHIVERHKGRIWAESPTQEAATRFTICIPLA